MNSHQLNKTPLISLIIPVYNVELYLRQCLNSAISQSYSNLEIIVIDDGSTDGCNDICNEYSKYPRVKVFHTRNKGLSAARNYGLAHLNPDTAYIAFLDSDDWLEVNAIQKLYNSISKYKADISVCRYYNERPNGRFQPYPLTQRKLLVGKQVVKSYILDKYIGPNAWNKLYKVELFDSIRYSEGMIFEDIETTCELIKKAKCVVIIPDPLIHYRIRKNSLSREFSAKGIVDYWHACYKQYRVLSKSINNQIYLQPLIRDCLKAINRMWRGYGGFSKTEKAQYSNIILQMMEYVDKHSYTILKGEFSFFQKITCLCAMSRNPIFLWTLNRLYRMFRFLKSIILHQYK